MAPPAEDVQRLVRLSGANLSDANLRGANLTDANLPYTGLRGV